MRALFRPEVRDPALKAPRGEARIRALFERRLEWAPRGVAAWVMFMVRPVGW